MQQIQNQSKGRDGFVWRALHPVEELASLVSENAGPGASLSRTEGLGLAHAALAGRVALQSNLDFMEDRSDRRYSDSIDAHGEAVDILPAVAAVALLATGEYGTDILEHTGLTSDEFATVVGWLSNILDDRYRPLPKAEEVAHG